ncbi:ribosome small subunit-dependent GTPase A [Corynebacterium sp. zg254]|uniref:Ribosome small subunit-dependent GTPase A n=1 Tax=Corynebacterium zhongnanshanii TaxID=2768834 RepID=A0ABQ6VEY4_9CORY|nr:MULTISPECIES: ribosome small subunit-dependent GTPase A [Corynebacterium]KAB3522986.1 ribosome small subunit-dependent GTPase A [Corynebacterium zhongnanshanii]MCR5913931.1 ribosome small subunit-dependent GTPase A [Corynebacterium sp. zg254]
MARRDWDESDIRIRPSKRSRPRTKDRPEHKDAKRGMVISKDRGRWGVVLEDTGVEVTCMRAREMGRTAVVVGDRVGVVGDTSGKKDTLARIVKLEERTSVLRRTADDTDRYERIVVANADNLLIVTAVADPPPRAGFVERALIAAFVGGLRPILCLTKSDLADPREFAAEFVDLGLEILLTGVDDDLSPLVARLNNAVSATVGHSGVGKSTLVNRLVPDAERATGEVSGVGKGRHTSTQSVALKLPGGGWVIDTPGIRSFGLAHVDPETIIGVFDDLREIAETCPRGCTHIGPPADPECMLDTLEGASARRVSAVRRLLEALRSNNHWEL